MEKPRKSKYKTTKNHEKNKKSILGSVIGYGVKNNNWQQMDFCQCEKVSIKKVFFEIIFRNYFFQKLFFQNLFFVNFFFGHLSPCPKYFSTTNF